jgi:hypothetical protein
VDSARQVVRWTIPGAVYVLFLMIYQLLTALSRDQSFQVLSTIPNFKDTAVGLALGLLSSMPIGFILYQFYYWAYRKGVLLFVFVRSDCGADVLQEIPHEVREALRKTTNIRPALQTMYTRRWILGDRFSVLMLKPPHRNLNGRREYADNRHRNWVLVSALLNMVAMRTGFNDIKEEHARAADVYHGQGAARTGLGFALVSYLAYNCYVNHGHLTERLLTKILTLSLMFGLTMFVAYVLSDARRYSFRTAQDTLVCNLRCLSPDDWAKILPPGLEVPQADVPEAGRASRAGVTSLKRWRSLSSSGPW